MKVLWHLSLLLAISNLYAQNDSNISLDNYISKYKQQEFQYDYEKNKQESLKLRDSWIMPLELNYRYNKSNPYDNIQTTKNASINLNQPIFRSGGIYYGIKFATANEKFSDYSIEMQRRKLIKEAIALLMQIKQNSLRYQKQKKQIDNAKIKLEQNKEAYLSGQLDSGFLDNSIIQLNLSKQILFDIDSTKNKLISKFKSISDIDYKNAYIPFLKNISKEEFLKNNIVLKLYKSQKTRDKYKQNVTIAKYLPNLAINASYNRDETTNPSFAGTKVPSPPPTTYYRYGFSVSMPLDFNTFRDIQSSKIDFLKSSVMIEDKKRELNSLYEQVEQNIKKIDNKIKLAKENYKIYKKLLDDTTKLYNAGYKTKADVKLLQNSADMSQIDLKIYKIDKQLELLNLYEYYLF
jgi:outer membrane protein TolC